MSRERLSPEIIAIFLGSDAAKRGPFGLLGLDISECTQTQIEAALSVRLDQLRDHPDGEGPEADKLRLELQKSAQQLMDPFVRAAMWQHFVVEQMGRGGVGAGVDPAMARAAELLAAREEASSSRSQSDRWLDEQNARSRYEDLKHKRRERIAVVMIGLAAFSFIAAFFLLLILVWPQGSGQQQAGNQGTAATATAGGTNTASTPSGGGPPASSSPAAPGGAAATSTQGAVGGGQNPAHAPTVSTMSASPNTSSPSTPPSAENDLPVLPQAVQKQVASKSFDVAPKATAVESGRIVKELRDAVKTAATDPGTASKEAERLYLVLRDWWPTADFASTRAGAEAMVQLIYTLAATNEGRTHASKLIERVRADAVRLTERRAPGVAPLEAEEVSRGTWAVAFISRLSRERDLHGIDASAAATLDDLLGASRSSAVTTFEGGAEAALGVMCKLILKPTTSRIGIPQEKTQRALKAWLECLSAIGLSEERREQYVLDAIDVAMRSDKDPADDEAMYSAIQELVPQVKWRAAASEGEKPVTPAVRVDARQRLLGWFDDAPAITIGDLEVVTGQIAKNSAASGVDPTMVLGVRASAEDRARMRARYAAAWGIESNEQRVRLLDDWRRAADQELRQPENKKDDPALRLWAAARAARLNEAAQAIWAGQLDRVPGLLQEQEPQVPEGLARGKGGSAAAISSPSPGVGVTRAGGRTHGAVGSWAEQFLAADRSIPLRMERLRELELASRPLSSPDAQVLVEAACFGAPYQVQFAAQKLVAKDTNDTAVLAAVLEIMPRTPKTRYVSEMIGKLTLAQLPPVSDAQWEFAARRALVGRLLGLAAASSSEAWQENLSRAIADAYLRAVSEESSNQSAADDAMRAAQLVQTKWREQAERSPFNPSWSTTLQQIDRRAQGRRALAVGPVQRFAAEQATVIDTMAYVVAAERQDRQQRVAAALADLAKQRRDASHIYEQVAAGERAMLRLWLLRLDERRGTP